MPGNDCAPHGLRRSLDGLLGIVRQQDGVRVGEARHRRAQKRYEAARIGRTTGIVEKSTKNGRRFHNPELANANGAAKFVDRQWSMERVEERCLWLFDYRVDEVSR